MGRKVRRVPPDWEHPRDAQGEYIPMHDHFPYNEAEIAEGLNDGWLRDEPPFYGIDVMPQWAADHTSAYQLYETTSEGTPVSPVFATEDEMVDWLTRPQPIGFGGDVITMGRDAARAFVRARYGAPTAIIGSNGVVSGLEGFGDR